MCKHSSIVKETKRKSGLTEDMFKLADQSLRSSLIEILLFMFYAASSSIIFFDYFLIVINFPDGTFSIFVIYSRPVSVLALNLICT